MSGLKDGLDLQQAMGAAGGIGQIGDPRHQALTAAGWQCVTQATGDEMGEYRLPGVSTLSP